MGRHALLDGPIACLDRRVPKVKKIMPKKDKRINRCVLNVEAWPAGGSVRMYINCTARDMPAMCLFYESRTKDGEGNCKFMGSDYDRGCRSPKARKAAAKKIIAALKKYILDKE